MEILLKIQTLFIWQYLRNKLYNLYINHAHWHRWLRSCSLRMGGNHETGVPWGTHLPDLVTTWPSHLQRRVLNSGCSGERRALYHWGSRAPYSVDLVTVFELLFYYHCNILYLLAISYIGQELLQKLQHYSDIAMQGQESVTTLDNLEAQKQVKRMLQYLESRVDKVAAYLENRDRSLNMDVQRDTVQREIRQVTCFLGGRPL